MNNYVKFKTNMFFFSLSNTVNVLVLVKDVVLDISTSEVLWDTILQLQYCRIIRRLNGLQTIIALVIIDVTVWYTINLKSLKIETERIRSMSVQMSV